MCVCVCVGIVTVKQHRAPTLFRLSCLSLPQSVFVIKCPKAAPHTYCSHAVTAPSLLPNSFYPFSHRYSTGCIEEKGVWVSQCSASCQASAWTKGYRWKLQSCIRRDMLHCGTLGGELAYGCSRYGPSPGLLLTHWKQARNTHTLNKKVNIECMQSARKPLEMSGNCCGCTQRRFVLQAVLAAERWTALRIQNQRADRIVRWLFNNCVSAALWCSVVIILEYLTLI